MSISVNGQSVVPPGFRFHPTEEELLTYYLKKKVASERIDLDVIRDVDLNKLEPWDIQDKCRVGSSSGPQNDWYFFSHKDRKYPTGTRTNRATAAGFWKATGRDKAIYAPGGAARRIGMRKTLVFYQGRAPHGHKSDWIMHEYRLDADHHHPCCYPSPPPLPTAIVRGAAGDQDHVPQEQEGWVICRVFKKKNLVHHGAAQSSGGGGTAAAASKMESSPTSRCSPVPAIIGDDALDHILQYMGGGDTKPALLDHHLAAAADATTTTTAACPAAASAGADLYGNNKFMKLPPLEHAGGGLPPSPGIADWDALDRLAAYELNGLSDASKNMAAFFDGDLWSMARSVSALHADLAMNNA